FARDTPSRRSCHRDARVGCRGAAVRAGPGQSRSEDAAKAVSTRAAAGRWHAEPRADRAQQRLLASQAGPGLQAGPDAPEGDSVSAVGESDRDTASSGAVEVRPAGLLHAAVRTASDDDAVPDGDPADARAETHRDDLRRRDAYLANHLHGWTKAS